VACEVVWAELAAWLSSTAKLDQAMDQLRVRFVPLDAATAGDAGRAWRAYRRNEGKRTRILADFLIAAHAVTKADRLLTRDQGFYRKYFEGLTVRDPTTQ
jgi:predicted nucleic acid-binding protein